MNFEVDEFGFPTDDSCATPADAMREFAYNVGGYERNVNSAWLLTGYDVWVRNPHYTGPAQRHPEDDCYDEEAPVGAVTHVDEDIPF